MDGTLVPAQRGWGERAGRTGVFLPKIPVWFKLETLSHFVTVQLLARLRTILHAINTVLNYQDHTDHAALIV